MLVDKDITIINVQRFTLFKDYNLRIIIDPRLNKVQRHESCVSSLCDRFKKKKKNIYFAYIYINNFTVQSLARSLRIFENGAMELSCKYERINCLCIYE